MQGQMLGPCFTCVFSTVQQCLKRLESTVVVLMIIFGSDGFGPPTVGLHTVDPVHPTRDASYECSGWSGCRAVAKVLWKPKGTTEDDTHGSVRR